MKSKQLILIAIALICGIVSAVGIFQAIASKPNAAEEMPMGPVLVASDHIDMKAELTDENVSLENWPKHLIPEGAASTLDDIAGKFSKTQLRSGQAVIMEDAVTKDELSDKVIPPGHKVINIKVPAEDLIGGLLEPGDKVDIIGVFDVGSRTKRKSETSTFLKGIRIFNIGTSTSVGEARAQSSSGIVGVIVTEKQSEKIVWARKNGEIRLALVGDHPSDNSEEAELPMGDDDDEQEEPKLASGMQNIQSFNRKPKIDMSKLRQVKVYSGGQMNVTYFNEEGAQVSPSKSNSNSNQFGSDMEMDIMSGSGHGASTGSGSSHRAPAPQWSNGASERPSVDYEESGDSVNFPESAEEDQYQGE